MEGYGGYNPVLKPLAEITNLLSKEDMPTVRAVYQLLFKLLGVLGVSESDSAVTKQLKKSLKAGLQTRFHLTANDRPEYEILLSENIIALESRYKSLRFLDHTQKEVVRDHLISFIEEVPQEDMMDDEPTAGPSRIGNPGLTSPAAAPRTNKPLLDCLHGDSLHTSGVQVQSAEHELETYITEPIRTSDPLQWWKSNVVIFLRLSKLAQMYLCIPATEVPSERSF